MYRMLQKVCGMCQGPPEGGLLYGYELLVGPAEVGEPDAVLAKQRGAA
jgi:hypothetical protein